MAADDRPGAGATPSALQLAAFDGRDPGSAVTFYYQGASDAAADFAGVAAAHGGKLIWAARIEQSVIGDFPSAGHAWLIAFARRPDARACITGSAHARIAANSPALSVIALSRQPRAIAQVSNLLAWLLPRWRWNQVSEPGEEPGVGTSSLMPTRAAIDKLRNHPQQHAPIAMVNWLRFRPRSAYPEGERGSGRDAYLRYGKVALISAHSLGAKLLYASRYQQVLIGNRGEPGAGLWDEFALMQYPGRSAFARMAALKRYRKALRHREAGLADRGQALLLTRPAPQFTWTH